MAYALLSLPSLYKQNYKMEDEKFEYIDDLYSCCVKLYETEVKKVIEELSSVQE